ncbi:MAG: hypothetical protein LBI06_05940 [Treponema sp.]|jgi:hypothetical protein|nr:hypothetical protein [Treponema sp.]
MKNTKAVFLALIICATIPLFAGATEPVVGVDFNIRFFDRRIYYVEGEPIYIQVTITNNSPSTYRFKLADDRAFSLDFDARTMSNRSLEVADVLIRKRTQSQQIFFREIAVESGESFSFVEDLRTYISIVEPGSLILQARLYPELFRPGVIRTASLNGSPAPAIQVLESKRLSLTIRPAAITGPDGLPLEMNLATGAQQVRERLAPDQVVEYTITARQKSQWEKFFLYLDLEAMLSRDAVRQRQWLAEREEGRRRMIEQFRVELQNPVTDGSISVIPTSFEIQRTQYNSVEGSVTVLKRFSFPNFTELKRYTYFVRLKDNIWTIVDYSVVNLGTE